MPRLATAAVELTLLAVPSTGWDSGAGPAPAAPRLGPDVPHRRLRRADWLLPAGLTASVGGED